MIYEVCDEITYKNEKCKYQCFSLSSIWAFPPYSWDGQFWKYLGLYWFILSTTKGWDYFYEFLEDRDGDFFIWKSDIDS